MSPAAVGLAVLLHALVAVALWWVAQEPKAPAEPALEVYFEPPPKPPEPKPEPPPEPQQKPEPQPQQQQPPPMPPIEALKPPADIVADKATQAPPKGDKPKDAELAPPPPELRDVLPSPDQDVVAAPTAAEFKEFAKLDPTPTPPPPSPAAPPAPQLQSILPTPGQDLPAPTAADFAKAEPAPKPPEKPQPPQQQALAKPPEKPQPPQQHQPPQPQQQQQAKPPMPQLQKPEIKPSPLSTAPSRRPPAGTQSENPSPSPFVNPADTYSKARAADNYLWQVVRRLQGYRYQANTSATQGITVVRVVIARDGRLLNVTVSRSSGVPEFDQGVLAGVRSGSPYAPLPPDIRGDSATFDLPLVSSRRM
jgi:protein TonB